jgi:hypothetical protein
MARACSKNHSRLRSFAAAAFAALAASGVASAFTAVEHFDYAAGTDIQGQSGGTGWTGVWTTDTDGTYVATSPGLTYPGISSSGNMALITPAANVAATSTIYRDIAQSFSNGVFYVGFMAMRTVTNDISRYFGLALFDGGTERILIGQGSGYGDWTINQIFGVGTLHSGVSAQSNAYLLAKFELSAIGAETVTFWVNPDFSQTEALNTPVGGTSYTTTNDLGTITRIRIGGGGPSGGQVASPHWLDEITISTLSPFAIPEPSVIALLAAAASLAATASVLRRRR